MLNYKSIKAQAYYLIIGLAVLYIKNIYNLYYYIADTDYTMAISLIALLTFILHYLKKSTELVFEINKLTISIRHLIISYYIKQLNEINKVIRINIDLSHLNLYPHKEELNLSLYIYRKLGYYVCITD
jgi:hypothetical protein